MNVEKRKGADASTDLSLVGGQPGGSGFFHLGLIGLGDGVDDAGHTSDGNGRDVAHVGGVAEEKDTRSSDGEPGCQRVFPDTKQSSLLTCSKRRPSSRWSTRTFAHTRRWSMR